MSRTMKRLRSIAVLGVFNGYVPIRNNPVWIVSTLIAPLSYLFLLYMIGREDVLGYAFVGGLVLTMSASTYGLLGDIIWYRESMRLQDMFLATPSTPAAYALGMALSAYIWAAPSMTVFVVMGYLVGVFRGVSAALVVLGLTVLLWVNTSLSVYLLSTVIKSEKYVWPLVTILSLGLSVFPPVYYPVTVLPRELWLPALTPPTASSAFLIEYYTGLIETDPVYVVYTVSNLVLQTLVYTVLFRRRCLYSN